MTQLQASSIYPTPASDGRGNLEYARIWEHAEALPWCALVTTGRTGTDFFQSLLDSHPQIFVFNGKLFFHDFWERAATVQGGDPLVAEDIADEFIGTNIIALKSRYDLVERKNELGESRDQSIDIDLAVFRGHLLELMALRPITSRTFLMAIYVAYALSIGEEISTKRIFFHHQHRINRLAAFIRDFPQAKIICMTRDPRANYVSGVEHWRRYDQQADNPAYPLYILWRAVDEADELHRYHPDRVRMLRLEDLGRPEAAREITAWMDVDYHSCLEHSTWGGLRWWGDRLSTNAIPPEERGYSRSIVANKWQEKLSRIDRFVLDYLLADMLTAYGYSERRKSRVIAALLVPFAILLPTTYERRYLSVTYLARALCARRVRSIIAAFYHPLRRMAYFYKLYGRSLARRKRFFQLIGASARQAHS